MNIKLDVSFYCLSAVRKLIPYHQTVADTHGTMKIKTLAVHHGLYHVNCMLTILNNICVIFLAITSLICLWLLVCGSCTGANRKMGVFSTWSVTVTAPSDCHQTLFASGWLQCVNVPVFCIPELHRRVSAWWSWYVDVDCLCSFFL